VDWVPPGVGTLTTFPTGPGPVVAGNAQTISGFDAGSVPIAGTTNTLNTTTFLAADVTTLTSAAQQDLINQLTANLTRVQNFSTGTG
jgi:hypothetical protein